MTTMTPITTVPTLTTDTNAESGERDHAGRVANKFKPRVVLAATDLSAPSHDVVRQAHRFALQHDARLVVLHVIPHGVGVNMLFPERTLREVRRAHAMLEDAEIMLHERVALLTGREGDDAVDLRVTHGDPATEILRIAEEIDAGLVVIGDRGVRFLSAAFGRTAKKVMRGAHRPVLVARPHRTTGVTLAATDFASPVVPALRAGAAHAEARLVFFHCVDYVGPNFAALGAAGAGIGAVPAAVPEAWMDLARCRLIADAVEIGATGATARVGFGVPTMEILRAAAEEDADLVVVRDDRRGPWGRTMFGSVAERVAMRARASVLVVGQDAGRDVASWRQV